MAVQGWLPKDSEFSPPNGLTSGLLVGTFHVTSTSTCILLALSLNSKCVYEVDLLCVYVCVNICIDVSIFTYIHIHTFTYIHIFTHTYMHILCICVYIYIYIYTSARRDRKDPRCSPLERVYILICMF